MNILSSKLNLNLQNDFRFQVFRLNISISHSSMRATCLAHLILLEMIVLTKFSEIKS